MDYHEIRDRLRSQFSLNLSPSTYSRALREGYPDGRGGRIYLEGVRVGGRWRVMPEALDKFIEKLTASRRGAPQPA